ncbi:MAG: sugar phosphate isomerase/epimerase [Acidobacteria bacterium]|nr:sugar phosphate isomerase/epimerase [Acidobacteriota bacterium]
MQDRRSALKAMAGVAAASGAAAAAAKGKLTLGVSTNDFKQLTNQELAAELKTQGIRCIQLFFTQKDSNLWRYGQRMDLSKLPLEKAKEIAATYRSAGMRIHGLGVYLTLIHGDAVERKLNLANFDAVMKLGQAMGIDTFLSEMGHWHPPGPAEAVPYDWRDDVWKMAVEVGKELAQAADANGATVLLEPIYRSILASAKRTRMFLEEVGSKRVRAQLDPANLLEVNDLEEMFGQLKGQIGGVHAKDRKYHVTAGVGAGKGDLDYRKFVTLAAEQTSSVPLIVEYVGIKDYKEALAHLRANMRAAGVKESA